MCICYTLCSRTPTIFYTGSICWHYVTGLVTAKLFKILSLDSSSAIRGMQFLTCLLPTLDGQSYSCAFYPRFSLLLSPVFTDTQVSMSILVWLTLESKTRESWKLNLTQRKKEYHLGKVQSETTVFLFGEKSIVIFLLIDN